MRSGRTRMNENSVFQGGALSRSRLFQASDFTVRGYFFRLNGLGQEPLPYRRGSAQKLFCMNVRVD